MERPLDFDELTDAAPVVAAEFRDGGAMLRTLLWGLGLSLVAVVAAPASCQSRIVGSVYDSLGTRGPLKQATLVLVERSQYATTDDRGQFTFDNVPAGRYSVGLLHAVLDSFDLVVPVHVIDVPSNAPLRIVLATPSAATAYRIGCGEQLPRVERKKDVVDYLKVRVVCASLARRAAQQDSRSVPPDSTTREGPRFQPMPLVIVRESLRVRSAMERFGFEERRRIGLGAFVAAEILSRHHYGSLENVLGTVRGVHVEYGTSGRPAVYLLGTKDTYCVPSFFVDGALYHLPLPALRRSTLRPGDSDGVAFGDISAIVPPAEIKGIEVYSSPGAIPPQFDYTSSTGCGSIVIWTR